MDAVLLSSPSAALPVEDALVQKKEHEDKHGKPPDGNQDDHDEERCSASGGRRRGSLLAEAETSATIGVRTGGAPENSQP